MPITLPDTTRIGRVALRVPALDPVVEFYTDVVGLRVRARGPGRVALGIGDTTLLCLIHAPDAPERERTEAGLFHHAIRVPDRAALGAALSRLDSQWQLTGASDHLVSEALYARDPAGNGVEIYRDRPRSEWPDTPDDRVAMDTLPLDREALLDAASTSARDSNTSASAASTTGAVNDAATADRLPGGTDMGHVHLEAVDLNATTEFYTDVVGLNLRQRMGSSATFLAAGSYHHHLGLNVWNGCTDPADSTHLGLAWYELVIPDETLPDIRKRIAASPAAVNPIESDGPRADDTAINDTFTATHPDAFMTHDPSGVEVRFVPEQNAR